MRGQVPTENRHLGLLTFGLGAWKKLTMVGEREAGQVRPVGDCSVASPFFRENLETIFPIVMAQQMTNDEACS